MDPRSRWIGLAAIGGAAVIAFVMTVGVFLPAIGELSARLSGPTAADPANLPAQILVCGREYAPSASDVGMTLGEVRERDGRDPVVVSAEADAGCPDGACIGEGLCVPVVYVVTPDDRYLPYDLVDAST